MGMALLLSCAAPNNHDQDDNPSGLNEVVASTEASISKSLSGTKWKLAEIRAAGASPESEPAIDDGEYQMTLGEDGRANFLLDCSQANGPWAADPVAGETGTFTVGALETTKAQCAQPPLDERIVKDLEQVQQYRKRDGHLDLMLADGGGTYVWEPADEQ